MKLSATDIERYYNLALQLYNTIEHSEINEVDKDTVKPQNKSIAIIYDHTFLSVSLLEVCLDLMKESNKIGYYKIYFDKNNVCVDDVFFLY